MKLFITGHKINIMELYSVENYLIVAAVVSAAGAILATQVGNEALARLGIRLILAGSLVGNVFITGDHTEELIAYSVTSAVAISTVTAVSAMFIFSAILSWHCGSWRAALRTNRAGLTAVAIVVALLSALAVAVQHLR